MTHAGLEEIVLDGPLHQVVADGRLGHFLVVLDGLVVVGLHRGQVGDFEEEFVREPVVLRHGRHRQQVMDRSESCPCALSPHRSPTRLSKLDLRKFRMSQAGKGGRVE